MTLQECYSALGGDYDEAAGRLRSDRLKFPADPSYDLLVRSMESQEYGEAFRAAHTIKGVCQNLAFTRLFESSNQLSEALRNGFTPEAPALAEQVGRDYQVTVEAIRAFQEANGG